MTESDKQKPGFFSRLFGRGATAPQAEPPAEEDKPLPGDEKPDSLPDALIEAVPLPANYPRADSPWLHIAPQSIY